MSAKRKLSQKRNKPKMVKSETQTPEVVFCRTCLRTEDLVSIFYNKGSEQKRSHDLRLVTGLEIKMDDGLSQKICTQCIDKLNQAIQFRRTSRKAEKTLLNMLTAKPMRRHSSRLQQPIIKKEKKAEKLELLDEDYSYGMFGDDFQNDDYEVVVKEEKKVKFKETPTATRKKRITIPNAMSYKCTTCSKEFRMKATYKAHLRSHTNFCVCETCGKRCRNNNQLQEHKRARHGLNRIHKCAYCDYSSATKEALTIHERRHTGERPYVCDHCGATFHRRSNLVQHIAIHLPEKNFQCNLCSKWEKSKKRLQVHVYKVHKEHRYRYLCPRCPKVYKCPDHVRRHLVNHHDVPRSMQGPIEKYVVSN